MKRITWIVPLVFVIVGVPLVLVWASSSRITAWTINPKTGNYIPAKREKEKKEKVTDPPKAAIHIKDFDFGVMDPDKVSKHVFVIHNEGFGVLRLDRGGTTCKCTEFKILDPKVAPGGHGRVLVAWKTVFDHGPFQETATIRTNDKSNEFIKLTVRGEIRRLIGFDPPQADFLGIVPDNPQTRSVVIYSQRWDDFSIEDAQCTMKKMTCVIEDVEETELSALNAKSGYRLLLTTPRELPTGLHSHRMQLKILPKHEKDPQTFELGVVAKVKRRLAIYGQGINSKGVVTIGDVRRGQRKGVRLLMKVHDEDTDLKLANVKTTPEFLEVSVTPHPDTKENLGLYVLKVEVPSDAPEAYYSGTRNGELTMSFDHPRIEDLTLKVVFAVFTARR